MAKKTKDTMAAAAAQQEGRGFLALRDLDFGATISKEMDGLDAFFERIKMPSGGATVFQIPSEDPDEPELMKEFSGAILYHHPIRAYFSTEYTGGTNPPDCGSLDCIEGYGNPGGDCHSCIYNDFGTGKNGAKACKERRRIYLLREGDLFPVMLSLPTGSLREFSRYIMRLLSKGNKSSDVVTRFSLAKATNKGGIPYAKACFKMERRLTAEELPLIGKLSEQIRNVSQHVGFERGTEASTEEFGTARMQDAVPAAESRTVA